MKRMLTFAAVALASAAFARPASAQFGGMGQAGSLADTIQKDAQSQLSDQKKYSAPIRRRDSAASRYSRPSYGGVDGTGRFDMSGRSVPGYFSLRDPSTSYSTRYSESKRRRPTRRPSSYVAPRRTLQRP